MTNLTFDGVDLSDAVPEAHVVKVTRQLLGARRDTWEDVPGKAGAWLFDEQPGDRIISVELAIVADTLAERRAAVAALGDWVDRPGTPRLIIDDEPDRYWLARLDSAPTPDEWAHGAEGGLEFRASPYAYALELSSDLLVAVDGIAQNFEIDDLIGAYPVIEIAATETMPDGFVLTVNGLQLLYGTPVANGETVTVSSLSFTVALGANTDADLTGVFVAANLSMSLVDGDFPVLIAGTNTLRIDGGNAAVELTWRRRYR